MGTSDGYVPAPPRSSTTAPTRRAGTWCSSATATARANSTSTAPTSTAIVQQLRTTPPFDELFCGINVHRIDVVSTESGADDPLDAPDSPSGTATREDLLRRDVRRRSDPAA